MSTQKSLIAGPKALAFSAITIGLAAFLARPITRFTTVLGVFRQPVPTVIEDGNLVTIPDTMLCEDLHLHKPSNLLFTACEDSYESRFSWFPGLGVLHDPRKMRGSLHVIDPNTFTSKRLEFEGFADTFVTHGIDVITDPEDDGAVYIFAINHLPNPEYVKDKSFEGHKAASQIEIFHHQIGSSTAKYVRSVAHPLIQTPNDIVARSLDTFYVTNDHYYREGVMRQIEDVYYAAKWSTTIFVQIKDMASKDSEAGIEASVALTGLHNNNGLGHGRTPDEIAIGSAASGDIHIANVNANNTLSVLETIPFDTAVDNPSWYSDPYSNIGGDASGYVSAGLSKAGDLAKSVGVATGMEPVMVWLAQHTNGKWSKKLLFEDDGKRLRSAATAVLIGIDPLLEGGKKKGWLFVTGFYSKSMIAVKVNL